uniref:GH03085p n=1 Tax=Drosophila melanogaster TaxID=7227 RepID=Q8T0V1_DROME|nr:GH03085p [Drosophila melanogaster]
MASLRIQRRTWTPVPARRRNRLETWTKSNRLRRRLQESEVDSFDVSDIPEFDEIPVVKRVEQNQDSIDAFSTLSKVAFAVPEVRDDPVISHALEIKAVVRELLYDLFEETASLSDIHNKDNKIRAKLDKNKLLTELDKVITTYLYEKYTNEMVGNRLVEYYKRNRNARVFATLSPENEKRFHSRYMHALALLDSLKYRLDVAKHKHAIQMNRVILDLHSAQSVASITEERLEHLFREHLVRPESDNLRRLVDRELRMMTAKRNEISDSRLFLITRKHTLGRIMGKIKELDTLSETLSIEDFLSVQNNVFALQKKIEERNTDLKRMRTQFLMDVHLTRHNREKALALAENFELSKIRLKNAMKNQTDLRRRLYEVKLERKKMRQQSRDMTFHGGILAMPSLMYDYDNTVERLKEKRETVAKLRETLKSLQRRLSYVEGRSI